MIGARHRLVLVVIFAASLWGLFWLPLRGFEQMGLAAGWAVLAQFVTPALLLAPLALWRAVGGRATGMGQAATGLLVGGAFALYAESLLLTEVARALILFYVTPVWGTLLELTFMGRRFTRPRAVALVMGLANIFLASTIGEFLWRLLEGGRTVFHSLDDTPLFRYGKWFARGGGILILVSGLLALLSVVLPFLWKEPKGRDGETR